MNIQTNMCRQKQTKPKQSDSYRNLSVNTNKNTEDQNTADKHLTEKNSDEGEIYEFEGNKFKISPGDLLPDIDEEALFTNYETMNIPYIGAKNKNNWDIPYNEDIPTQEECVLIVTHLPSGAKTIANTLSGDCFTTRSKTLSKCLVHEFKREFFGKMSNIRVTSQNGHIYQRNFENSDLLTPSQIDNARSLFDEKMFFSECDPKLKIIEHLRTEAKDCSNLVLWLDNDTAGENMCFQVLLAIRDHLRVFPNFVSSPGNPQNIFRAKSKSMQQYDDQQAYNELFDAPDYRLSSCYDVKKDFEKKVAMSFGRKLKSYLRTKFPLLNDQLVTFGVFQTPLLNVCVQQYLKVQTFKAQKYWKLNPQILIEGKCLNNLPWLETKIFDKKEAENLKQQIDKISEFEVIKLETRKVVHHKPLGLNSMSQLKYATQKYKIKPSYILKQVENLYLWGYITFPGSKETSYSKDLDIKKILYAMSHFSDKHSEDAEFIHKNMQNPQEGNGLVQGTPIIPTGYCPKSEDLKFLAGKIYNYICQNFFASLCENMVVEETEVTFQVANQTFTVIGREKLEEGYAKYDPDMDFKEQLIPEFEQGKKYCISKTELLEKSTEAPELFTEYDVIGLMDDYLKHYQYGMSIVEQIHNLENKNYLSIDSFTRQIKPTDIGIAMAKGYAKIDPGLVSVSLIVSIEERIQAIVDKKLDHEKVLDSLLQFYKEKFVNFEQKINLQDAEFSKFFGTKKTILPDAAPFSKCGNCGNLMIFKSKITVNREVTVLDCSHCNVKLSLPKYAKFSKPDGIIDPKKYCPHDKFEIIYYEYNDDGLRTKLTVCPQCFNRPVFDIESYGSNLQSKSKHYKYRLTCSSCPSKECEFSKIHTSVKNCSQCKKGDLILNKIIGVQLNIGCNNNDCRFITTICKNAKSAEVTDKWCDCGAKILDIKFTNGNDFYSCVFCDPYSQALMDDNKGFSPSRKERKHNLSQDNVRELFDDDGLDDPARKLFD